MRKKYLCEAKAIKIWIKINYTGYYYYCKAIFSHIMPYVLVR